jgi:TM2 domain-containing membrane protein YozV
MMKSAGLAAVLSFLIPGLGQIYKVVRAPRRGGLR